MSVKRLKRHGFAGVLHSKDDWQWHSAHLTCCSHQIFRRVKVDLPSLTFKRTRWKNIFYHSWHLNTYKNFRVNAVSKGQPVEDFTEQGHRISSVFLFHLAFEPVHLVHIVGFVITFKETKVPYHQLAWSGWSERLIVPPRHEDNALFQAMFLTKGHTALSEVHKPAHILQHKFCTAGLIPGSPREISPGGYGDRHRPPVFPWALVETCSVCLYRTQNKVSC